MPVITLLPFSATLRPIAASATFCYVGMLVRGGHRPCVSVMDVYAHVSQVFHEAGDCAQRVGRQIVQYHH